jgi:hypothetical protein
MGYVSYELVFKTQDITEKYTYIFQDNKAMSREDLQSLPGN